MGRVEGRSRGPACGDATAETRGAADMENRDLGQFCQRPLLGEENQ